MKSSRTLAALVFGLALGPATLAQPQVVELVGDPWPPYIFGELGHEASGGAGVALMHAIFAELDGYRLSVPLVPWNRALREVEQGKRDGIGILFKTRERQLYMDYTEELFRSHGTIWYSAARFDGGFGWQDYSDFSPYTLGVIRGHSHGEPLDSLIAEGTLRAVQVGSASQLFAMLQRGRIDFAVADRLVGQSHAQEYARRGTVLLATEKAAPEEIYYIAFSRHSPARELIPQINQIIKKLRVEGVIERLVGEPAIEASAGEGGEPENSPGTGSL